MSNPSNSTNLGMNQFVAANANKFFGGALHTNQAPGNPTPNYQNQLLPNSFAGYQVHSPAPPTSYLPIGQVKIVGLQEPIPQGWRKMTYQEGNTYKEQLKQMLGEWSIVAFDHGKIDGSGYGNLIHESYGSECGEKFIVKSG